MDEELAEFASLLPAALLSRWREAPAETFMHLDSQIEARRQQIDQQAEVAEEQQQRQMLNPHPPAASLMSSFDYLHLQLDIHISTNNAYIIDLGP